MAVCEVRTQEELNKALAEAQPQDVIACVGSGRFVVWGSAHVVARGSAHVVARGSAHVEARGSAHVEARGSAHVEAWGSAHVEAWGSAHVVAWGSAHVDAGGSAHVEAWGSAHVVAWGSAHVDAGGSAHVVAGGSAHVVASKHVSVHRMTKTAVVEGGVVIEPPEIDNAADWCEYYGVRVEGWVATLYKSVRADFGSDYDPNFRYLPGTAPEAPDWDPEPECGSGLHFSPTPIHATSFYAGEGHRFVACPVALADIVVHKGGTYPAKVKAPRLAAPCYEVDRYGKPVLADQEVTA